LLVERLDPMQDRDRLDQRRLVDENWLEAALEGRILLDVLAVLVEGGRADALDLAASESGLEDVGGIDGAFRRAGTDQRVQLVDEEHHFAAGEDLYDPLDLGLATDHRVERVLRRQVGEVAAKLVEQRRLGRLLRGRRLFVEAALVQQPVDFAAHLLQVRAQVLEDMSGDAFTFDQETEKQVLGAHVVVAHAAGFLEGDLDDLLYPRGGDDLLDDDALV